MNVSPHIAREIDREFRVALLHDIDANEVRMARALLDVNAVEVNPRNVYASVVVALGAAAIINRRGLMPSQIRRLYGNGGHTYDYVTKAVAAAR